NGVDKADKGISLDNEGSSILTHRQPKCLPGDIYITAYEHCMLFFNVILLNYTFLYIHEIIGGGKPVVNENKEGKSNSLTVEIVSWRLNRVHQHKGEVWVHHGEPFEAEINENYDHVDEYIGINEDDSMNENEEDEPDNRIRDMIRDHFIESATWKDSSDGKKHIPEKILIENISGLQNMEGTLDLLSSMGREDTINARLDLEEMSIRKHLRVKFPDGYASNLAKSITSDGCNLQGLKTHDCHILLQRILHVAIRGIMHRDIYEAIAELGQFFQQLCAKTVNHFYNMDGCTQMVWFQYLKIYKEELADQGTPYWSHVCVITQICPNVAQWFYF
ncbi:hypothetical protein ACJX0J_035354, partial [Zea mays]